MFIVFDGLDGGGKSTQLELLAQWFRRQHKSVVVAKDPGSTELGEQIRSILLGKHDTPIDIRAEMMLFTTARTQLVEQIVRPALARNEIVLLDRYILSTVVYQGYAGELDPEELWTINQIATQNLMPDLTFVFDLPVEVSMTRLGSSLDRMESRGEEYFRRVRAGFLAEAQKSPLQICVIDARQSVAEVQAAVIGRVEKTMELNKGTV